MKIKKLLFVSLFSLIFLIYINCKKNPVEKIEVTDHKVLVPLDLGNSWTYIDYTYGGSEGKILPGLTDSFRFEITDIMNVNYQETIYEIAVRSSFYPVWETTYHLDLHWMLWNDENGLYIFGGKSSTDIFIKKVLQYKYPVEVGDNWKWHRIVYDYLSTKFFILDTLTVRCVGKNVEFHTRIGSFKCIEYKYRLKPAEDVNAHWNYFDYYKPGIGLVGGIIKSSLGNKDIKYRRELINYKIKSSN